MNINWIVLGAISGGLAVAAGAFGAHGLQGKIEPRLMEIFHTAAHYHLMHSLALVAVGLLATRGSAVMLAGVSFALGILMFSGSLYALAISNVRWLGAITPLGGVSFIVGWAALAWSASQLPKS